DRDPRTPRPDRRRVARRAGRPRAPRAPRLELVGGFGNVHPLLVLRLRAVGRAVPAGLCLLTRGDRDPSSHLLAAARRRRPVRPPISRLGAGRIRAGMCDVRDGVHQGRSRDARVQLERAVPDRDALHHLRPRRGLAISRSSPPRPAPCRGDCHAGHASGHSAAHRPRGELSVRTAPAIPQHHLHEPAESPLTPESWGKLGMWIFLAADAMTFGALLAGYGALRYGDPNWPRPSTILGIPLTAFMTFLLICSSVTMVEALAGVRQGKSGKFRR